MTIIVGINDSHDAAACIVKDGALVCAVSEERIQRIKSIGGFPANAIDACLDIAGISRSDVDHVAFGNTKISPFNLHNAFATLTVKDHIRIEEEYWQPVLYEGADVKLRDVLPDYAPAGTLSYPLNDIPFAHMRELDASISDRIHAMRRDFAASFFGIDPANVHFIDHHTAHAYYAFFANPLRGKEKDFLIVTGDAGGDGAYQSISTFRNGRYKRLHHDHEHIVASLYSRATLLLSMRPNEHEYKVMGLAPYATEHHKKGPREIFMEAVTLDGVAFKRNPAIRDLYTHFRNALKAHRFDGIAGGIQDFAEHFIVEWLANAVKMSGIGNIAYAGGLSLNVKANKRALELDAIYSLFVPPGAGDESLPIGAAYRLIDEMADDDGATMQTLPPFPGAYLGNRADAASIAALTDHPIIRADYDVIPGATPDDVARHLAAGEICAVFCDTMEFGPRALGHRSLLADASRPASKERINSAIKKRDFWMPFAPAVLAERFDDYAINPKNSAASYMTMTFDTTELGRRHLAAALHPVDHTARMQSVEKDRSPNLYAILKAFEARTGIGGVLNTSLNIHGKPIVMKPVQIANEILSADGIELNVLYVEDTLFVKKGTRA